MAEYDIDHLEQRVALLEDELRRSREQLNAARQFHWPGNHHQHQPRRQQRGSKRKRSAVQQQHHDHELFYNGAAAGEPKPKSKYKLCNAEGCTRLAQQGGVCVRHGAILSGCKYIDSSGMKCPKHQQRGGYCKTHAPPVYCITEGCANRAIYKSGVCAKHNGDVPAKCRHEGCTKCVKRGGFCEEHHPDYVPRICAFEGEGGGCMEHARKGRKYCIQHSASRKKKEHRPFCNYEGCTSRAYKFGRCCKHGGKPTCSAEGCTNLVATGGVFCQRHGTGPKRCNVEGCNLVVKKGGVCGRHIMPDAAKMAPTPKSIAKQRSNARPRCNEEGCNKFVKRGMLFCTSHHDGQDYVDVPNIPEFEGCAEQDEVSDRNEPSAPSPKSKVSGKQREQKSKQSQQATASGKQREQKERANAKPRCNEDGCNKFVKKGETFCTLHGKDYVPKICGFKGCTAHAKKVGTYCIQHSAQSHSKRRDCSFEGCTSKAYKFGVCCKHGGKPTCKVEECTNLVATGGVFCQKHGSGPKLCNVEGCNHIVKRGRRCKTHGLPKPPPTFNLDGYTKLDKHEEFTKRNDNNDVGELELAIDKAVPAVNDEDYHMVCTCFLNTGTVCGMHPDC